MKFTTTNCAFGIIDDDTDDTDDVDDTTHLEYPPLSYTFIMVRASTLALNVNLVQVLVGLEFLGVAHPKSAVFAFVPTVFLAASGAALKKAASTAAGAFALSVVGTLFIACGLASAMKLRDRTTRVGEKWFVLANAGVAANQFIFRNAVPGLFPVLFITHAALAVLFHLGDDVKIPIRIPGAANLLSIGAKPGKRSTRSASSGKKAAAKRSSSRRASTRKR